MLLKQRRQKIKGSRIISSVDRGGKVGRNASHSPSPVISATKPCHHNSNTRNWLVMHCSLSPQRIHLASHNVIYLYGHLFFLLKGKILQHLTEHFQVLKSLVHNVLLQMNIQVFLLSRLKSINLSTIFLKRSKKHT